MTNLTFIDSTFKNNRQFYYSQHENLFMLFYSDQYGTHLYKMFFSSLEELINFYYSTTKQEQPEPKVLALAVAIMQKTNDNLFTCIEKAKRVIKVKAKMKVGATDFVFKKKDGTMRNAKGTLCPNLLPQSSRPTGAAKKRGIKRNPLQISFYDLAAQSWKSFKAETFLY